MKKLILLLLALSLHVEGATSLIIGTKGGAAWAAGITVYGMLATGNFMSGTTNATETTVQFPIAIPGTFSKLKVKVTANSTTANTTVTFRKAATGTYPQTASDGNEIVTISSGQTGLIDETNAGGSAHTDHVNAGDYINLKIAVGATGTSITITGFEILFTPDDTSKTWIKLGGYTTTTALNSAGTHYYQTVASFPGAQFNGISETVAQLKLPTGGVWKNLCVNMSNNTYGAGNDGAIRSRVGGVDGAQNATITANTGSTAKQYCDTGSGDTVSSGDLINIDLMTASGGSGAATVTGFASDFITSDNTSLLIGQTNVVAGTSLTSSTTYYAQPVSGGMGIGTTQGNYQFDALTTFTLNSLRIYVITNTLTNGSTTTFNMWKGNATASTLTLSITGTTDTGWIDAPANSDNYAAGDLIELKGVIAAGTAITVETFVAKVTYPAATSTKIRHSVRGSL